jgi:hypothetical protein
MEVMEDGGGRRDLDRWRARWWEYADGWPGKALMELVRDVRTKVEDKAEYGWWTADKQADVVGERWQRRRTEDGGSRFWDLHFGRPIRGSRKVKRTRPRHWNAHVTHPQFDILHANLACFKLAP